MFVLVRFLPLCVLLLLTACNRLGTPQREGVLVLGMVAEPVIQFYDGSPAEGYTRDFAAMFGEHLGVPVRVQFAANYQELGELVRAGQVHVAAYVSASPKTADLLYSVPIGTRPLWVVQLANTPGPKRLADLHGLEIHTPVGSAAGAALRALAPAVVPRLVEDLVRSEMELFDELDQGRIRLVAVDELYMQYAANTYPELQPAVQIPGQRVFAWALPRGSEALLQTLNAFITASQAERLPKLRDKYFGYIRRLDTLGAQSFIADVETKLPRFRRHFHKAQELTGIDWRQLAALAYQESKWEPNNVSYTGVRGLMMLTEPTAADIGITNRKDPVQSILGGSLYLHQLMQRLPPTTPHPDRLWLALAAYNLGLGHVHTGRALAMGLQKNPDSWFDMKKVLPLLARPHVYRNLKTGRARGGEAVILVENVRSFYDILSNLEPAHEPVHLVRVAQKPASKKLRTSRRKGRMAHQFT